jgi:hypothetical protein
MIQKQFHALSKSPDLKSGKIEKSVILEQLLCPLLVPAGVTKDVIERVWFVLDTNGLQNYYDYNTFLHACYVLMFSAREEKFKCMRSAHDTTRAILIIFIHFVSFRLVFVINNSCIQFI